MLSLADAFEILKAAVFRLRIEKNSHTGSWECGTGFFVSEEIALTAYHNLPSGSTSSSGSLTGAFREGEWFQLRLIESMSLPAPEGDIAVLKLVGAVPENASHLRLGYVPLQIPSQERALTWAGRPVCLLGFPFERASAGDSWQERRFVPAFVDSTQPIIEHWKGDGLQKLAINGSAEWLRMHGDGNAMGLEGISGAPILDRDTGMVVGVQHSYIPMLKVIYATETARLARVWPAFSQIASAIAATNAGSTVVRTATSLPPLRAKTATVRGLLPSLPKIVIGRKEVITELHERLTAFGAESAGQLTVVVRGVPGVGKTSLVAALTHDPGIRESFPDGILWASLGQHPNTTPVLEDWLSVMTGSSIPSRDLSPANLQGQLTSILSDKRVLLVIDDVWDASDAEPLRLGGIRCSTLITTRETEAAIAIAGDPGGIYTLQGLNAEMAIELLIALAPWVVLRYSDEAQGLVEDFAGLPLAIHVAAQLLNSEMNYGFDAVTVPALLEEIRNGAALLRAKPPSDRGVLANATGVESVAVLLDLSTRRLSDPDRLQFALLGAMAPKPAKFDFGLIQAVWDTADPKPTIRTLVDRGLLEPMPGGSFQMHYLLVLHARELAATLTI